MQRKADRHWAQQRVAIHLPQAFADLRDRLLPGESDEAVRAEWQAVA